MFCGECGAATTDQATFCPACGRDLRWQRARRERRQQSARFDETVSSTDNASRSGFWRRFAAHAIDVAIVWFAMEIVWFSFLGIFKSYLFYHSVEGFWVLALHFFSTPLVSQSFITALYLSETFYHYVEGWLGDTVNFVPLAAILAYYVIGTAKWGRTLGKAALGIRVVGPDGNPPGIIRTIIRETLGKFLSGIFWIGFLMAAGKQKRGLHDRISGTEVVVEATTWLKRENLTQEDAR